MIEHLGSLALAEIEDGSPEKAWLDDVSGFIDRMQARLGKGRQLIDALSQKTIEPETEETELITQAEPEEPAEEAADTQAQDENDNESLAQSIDLSSLEAIKVSPNETMVTRATIYVLDGSGELMNYRSIFQEVFGQSRLSKGEEARFFQIMNQLTGAGLLKSSGKSYGILQPGEALPTDNRSESPTLTDYEQDLIRYMESISSGELINVGQIVRGYFKAQTLPPEEFQAVVSTLNALADRGFIVHDQTRPAWYAPRPGEVKPFEKAKSTNGSSEITPILTETIIDNSLLIPERYKPEVKKTSTPSETAESKTDDSPAGRLELEVDEARVLGQLSDREKKIWSLVKRSVKPGKFFAQKEVDLESMDFTSESARRQAWGKFAKTMTELGVFVDNGKSRGGKKYKILGKAVATAEQKSKPPATAKRRTTTLGRQPGRGTRLETRFYERADQRATRERIEKIEAARLLELQSEPRTQKFAQRLLVYIVDQIKATDNGELKLSNVARDISDILDIDNVEARDAIKSLVHREHIFVAAKRRGSPYLGLERPSPEAMDRGVQASKNARQREMERIEQLRNQYGPDILKMLAKLNKTQSEFRTTIAKSVPGLNEKDVNSVCNLMRRQGLLVGKRRKNRGTGKTKKGKTWQITSRGRREVGLIEQPALTRAEKTAIGRNYTRRS